MAAVEMFEETAKTQDRPPLRLVRFESAPTPLRSGLPLAQRRAARARMMKRRRRALVVLTLLTGLTILALPGVAFGGVSGGAHSSDLNSNATLAVGVDYVVQPGDTLNAIARMINPADPSRARSALVYELDSTVVVAGEHVQIP